MDYIDSLTHTSPPTHPVLHSSVQVTKRQAQPAKPQVNHHYNGLWDEYAKVYPEPPNYNRPLEEYIRRPLPETTEYYTRPQGEHGEPRPEPLYNTKLQEEHANNPRLSQLYNKYVP